MTSEQNPIAVDDSDAWPLKRTGMTLRRKLVLVAIPAVLAIVSLPIGIAQAHGVAKNHVAVAATAHVTKTVAVKHSVAAKHAVKAAVKTAATPAEPAETTTDPAETGTDTGHSDEVAGSTTENSVDHQFDGQE